MSPAFCTGKLRLTVVGLLASHPVGGVSGDLEPGLTAFLLQLWGQDLSGQGAQEPWCRGRSAQVGLNTGALGEDLDLSKKLTVSWESRKRI